MSELGLTSPRSGEITNIEPVKDTSSFLGIHVVSRGMGIRTEP